MNGILVLDKPKNKTSRDVVNEVSKLLNTKKIGHTGTLDPIATGVLVLCINKATKIVEIITSYDKEYIAEVILGIKTDTGDITGNIIQEKKPILTEEQLDLVLDKMIGIYNQKVPIYSAVKINGKKLYEYARENIEIKCPKRLVEIKELKRISKLELNENQIKFKIKCSVSKGTYIRRLIEDIACNLNTVGTMSNLERIRQGNFTIKQAITIKDIENNNYKMYEIEEILQDIPKIEVDSTLYFKIKNGSLIKNCYKYNTIMFTKNNKIIAIYKKYDKDKKLMKPWKMLL